MAHEPPQQPDFVDLDDIDLFTNTDFFDFDLNVPVSDLTFPAAQQQPAAAVAGNDTTFQPGFYQPAMTPFSTAGNLSAPNSLPPSPPNGLPMAGQLEQSQPTLPSAQHFTGLLASQPQPQQPQPSAGQKRKAGSLSAAPVDLEEESRNAAEEDKRRRNTAASARFRVKKKQREQALEQTAKEMTERVQVLEARIGQLETENRWLKGLITDKDVALPEAPAAVAAPTEGGVQQGESEALDPALVASSPRAQEVGAGDR